MIERKLDKDEIAKNIRHKVAVWFARIINEKKRYDITFEQDPAWDHSGNLFCCGNFDIKNYYTLENFVEEYTGSSTPSYESGCGLYHNTYDFDFHDMIEELIISPAPENGDLDDEIYDYEYGVVLDVIMICLNWLCEELYNEGKEDAEKELLAEEDKKRIRALELKAEKEKGEMILEQTLSKELFYKVKNTYIEKTNELWKELKLNLSKLSCDEIKLVSHAIPHVSNSIRTELDTGMIKIKIKRPKSKKKIRKAELLREMKEQNILQNKRQQEKQQKQQQQLKDWYKITDEFLENYEFQDKNIKARCKKATIQFLRSIEFNNCCGDLEEEYIYVDFFETCKLLEFCPEQIEYISNLILFVKLDSLEVSLHYEEDKLDIWVEYINPICLA